MPTFSTAATCEDFHRTVDSGITIQDNSRIVSASKSQILAAQAYDMEFTLLPALSAGSLSTARERIRSLCELQNTSIVGQHAFKNYTSETLAEYIPMCSSISCIQESSKLLYVNYISTDGKTVSLVYSDAGLHEKNIYDPATDSLMHQTSSIAELRENFRKAISYEMSDELECLIRDLIAAKNWDALSTIDGLDININGNGIITVEPKLDTTSTSQLGPSSQTSPQTRSGHEGFTSTSALLADLNSHFPAYTHSTKYATSVYCNALSQTLSARVYETRNEYTKKTANWQVFGAGSSLSAIGIFLGIASLDIVSTIVSALGLTVSIYDTIQQQVTLYNSAVYTYWGERSGYIYDPTVYNDYVRVIIYGGKGEFTGGYTSSGVFDWVHSGVSAAFNHSYSSIIEKTKSNYNTEIVMYDYCTNYYPASYY